MVASATTHKDRCLQKHSCPPHQVLAGLVNAALDGDGVGAGSHVLQELQATDGQVVQRPAAAALPCRLKPRNNDDDQFGSK